jgi:hypothetical protein
MMSMLATRGRVAVAAAAIALGMGGAGCGSTPPPPPSIIVVGISTNPNAGSVVAGATIQGVVSLSAAPTSTLTVTLSSNSSAATVPQSITANAGNQIVTFTITAANSVSSNTAVVITASLNGSSVNLNLNVTAVPLPTASFTVSGPQGTDRCRLQASFTLDCTFDGTGSTGNPTTWIWTYSIGPNTIGPNTNPPTPTSSRIVNPNTTLAGNGCGLFNGQTGPTQLMMVVSLIVRNANGDSTVFTKNNVTVLPSGVVCGF